RRPGGHARRPLPPASPRAPAHAGGRPGPRHDPHASRRPRVERLDVRGARRGRHAGRPHAALTAAIATLKGPRHGGANEDVLAMLLEIDDPGRAEAYVAARLDAHARSTRRERADPRTRIPGFGHRVYRVDDARARVLRHMAKTMAEATGHSRLFEVAERVYAAVT